MKTVLLRNLLLPLTALAASALVAGCERNTTSAANPERRITAPPVVTVHLPPVDPRNADPLTAPVWRAATWLPLTAPANTPRTTAPCQAAIYYDPSTLYVAFIADQQPDTTIRDVVSLYLDTTSAGDGTELIRVQADAAGTVNCSWIRLTVPAVPLADGSPDLGQPVREIPDVQIPGLTARVGRGLRDGNAVWTAVLAVPLAALPTPLRIAASPGLHWKINLLRNVTISRGGERADQLQANLSPVSVGAQAVSPYRLSDLELER